MKIGDLLFFAPGIRFDELDLTGAKLPEQLQQRIGGYYVEPRVSAARTATHSPQACCS